MHSCVTNSSLSSDAWFRRVAAGAPSLKAPWVAVYFPPLPTEHVITTPPTVIIYKKPYNCCFSRVFQASVCIATYMYGMSVPSLHTESTDSVITLRGHIIPLLGVYTLHGHIFPYLGCIKHCVCSVRAHSITLQIGSVTYVQ